MGFIKGLKRALGVDTDYNEDDDLDGMVSQRTPYVNPFKKEEPIDLTPLEAKPEAPVAVSEPKAVATVEEELPEGVFDGIITIINGNMPEFVRDCIDLEKERKAVYVAMGPQFRDYIRNIRRTSLDEARNEWVEERAKLAARVNQADQRANEAVQKAAEIKERLMSEERQRRAIVERSHTLEASIANLEAKQEQSQLENKSLLNKVKVMQVKLDDAEKDGEEMARLRALINEQRHSLVEANKAEVRLAELSTENEDLRNQIEQLTAAAGHTELESEFKSKMEIANALINELRASAAQKEKEVGSLTEKFRLANEEIENLQYELATAQKNLEIAAEVQEKIEQFEEIKNKKDAEIRSLRAKLAEAQDAGNASANAIEQSLKEAKTENNRLQMQVAQAERKIAELTETNRSRSVDLAKQIEELNGKLKLADERAEAAETKLAKVTKANSTAQAELKKLKADNMAMVVNERNLRDNIADRDREIAELNKAMKEGRAVEIAADAAEEYAAAESVAKLESDGLVVSAIDDIDDIDWLMPSPPSEPEPEVVVEEAPAERKPAQDIGSAQMSLF